MWSRFRGQAGGVFVPKGQNDGSDSTELAEVLAVYCLEWVVKRVVRPVGTV